MHLPMKLLSHFAVSVMLGLGLNSSALAATFTQEYVSINDVDAAISAPTVSVLHAAIGPGALSYQHDPLNSNLRDIVSSIEFKGVRQESRLVLDIANVSPATWTQASLTIDSNAHSAVLMGGSQGYTSPVIISGPTVALNNIDAIFSDAYVVVSRGYSTTRVATYLNGNSLLGLEGNSYQPINAIHISGLNLASGTLNAIASFDWNTVDNWYPGTMSVYLVSPSTTPTAPVPLPTTFWLLGSGLLGLVGLARKKNKA